MRIPSTHGKLVVTLLGLAAAVTAWLFLAPATLGGSTTYVVTEGVSMQPRFHSGDLALVRKAAGYRVGDVVAYHSHQLHTIVLHRIVAHDGDRYVFKGDNNNFIDPERPTQDQLVGKLWVHFAGKGHGLLWLGSPKIVGGLLGLAVLLLLGSTGAQRVVRRRRRGKHAPPPPGRRLMVPSMLHPSAGSADLGLLVSGLALALCLAFAVLAFSQRGSASVEQPVSYRQTGSFDYWASARRGDVYPEGRVLTGDTVFSRLVKTVNFRFAYKFDSSRPHLIGGTASLDAVLRSSSGWKRRFHLQAPERFEDDHVVVEGRLALPPLARLVQRVEAETGVPGTYTLSIVPRVAASGTIDGGRTKAAYSPTLDFSFDPLVLKPSLPAPDPSATPGTPTASPLTPSASGTATVKTSRPRVVRLPKLTARPGTIAQVAGFGAFASLGFLMIFLVLLRRGRDADEDSRIRARHGEWLVPVTQVDTLAGSQVVEVTTFDTLVRLAERSDRMVLHAGSDYRIFDDGIVYAYTAGTDPPPEAPEAPPRATVPPAPPPPPPVPLVAVPAAAPEPDRPKPVPVIVPAATPEPEPELERPEPVPVTLPAAAPEPPKPKPVTVPTAAPEPEPEPKPKPKRVTVPVPVPIGPPRVRPKLRSPSEQAQFLDERRGDFPVAGTG